MKTLEEAVSTIYEENEGDKPRVKDSFERFKSTATEAAQNDKVLGIASSITKMALRDFGGDPPIAVATLLVSILMKTAVTGITTGIKIGMEMEKAE